MKKAPKKRKGYVYGTEREGVTRDTYNGERYGDVASSREGSSLAQLDAQGNPINKEGLSQSNNKIDDIDSDKKIEGGDNRNLGQKIQGSTGWWAWANKAKDIADETFVKQDTVTDPTTGKEVTGYKGQDSRFAKAWSTPTHKVALDAAKEGNYGQAVLATNPLFSQLYKYSKLRKDNVEYNQALENIETEKQKVAANEAKDLALAARERGETGYSTASAYRRDPSVDEKKVSTKENIFTKFGDKLNFAKGGEIVGKGTGTSDSINAEVEEGSFVVPAKHAHMGKMIKEALLKKKTGKANLHQKDGVPVKLSDGEILFTKDEKEEIEKEMGEEMLEALAPEAEENEEGMAKGGELSAAKARKILHDKEVNGKPLTDKQRRYMGWVAGGSKMATGGEVDGDYPKELDNKFDSLRAKTEEDLKKAFPNKDVKVVYKGKERSLADQKKQFEKGSSTTKFGLHGIGAARDFNIIIDGRVLGNSKADHKIYQDYLWKNAEKDGLYHLNKDEFGKIDPYHIGLVEEKGDGTAFKRLVQAYPEITKTKQFQSSLKELQDIKAKNPKDTTYDSFLNSVKEVKPEVKKTEVYNDNMSNIFSKINAPKNQNSEFSATEELNKISAKEKADAQNRKSAYEKSKAYKEKINEYMDKASDEKDKNAELTRINNGLAARKKEYDNILEKEKDPSKRAFGESDMRIAEQKKAVLKKLQELESAKSNASTVAVKETPKSNPFTGTTASAKKEVANNIFSKINQQPNLASTEVKDDVANITNPNKNAIDTVPITNETYVSPQDYALFNPKSNGSDPNLDKYNKDLAEANNRTSPFGDPNLERYNKDLADANARTTTDKPNFWDKVKGVGNVDLGGALTSAINYGLGAYQIKEGRKGLQGERPIDKIDPTFQANVDTAQANAKFGFTPEQKFLLDQQNQNLLNQEMFAAKNYAGGSGGNAFNMSRNAANNAFTRSLQNAAANTELQQGKQQFAAQLAAQKAQMSRNIFEDSLRAFEQKQQAAGNLIGAGTNTILDANRFANYMRLRGQENEFKTKYEV